METISKKKNEKSHEIGGERPVGYSMVPLDNLEATTSYVNLPFIPQYGHEQDIADDVLAATSHEDTHRAMAQIGEFYDLSNKRRVCTAHNRSNHENKR